LRGALARRHPVVVGPVPHGRIGVAHHVVGDVVDVDVLLGHGIGGGHRQVVGAQESDGGVPVDRVAAGESAHLHHVPERGAAVLLLHEGFAQMFAEVVVALPHAVDVERDEGAARPLLTGADVDAAHQLVLDERIGDVVFAGAQAHVLKQRHAALGEEGVVLRRLAQLAAEVVVKRGLVLEIGGRKAGSGGCGQPVARPGMTTAGDTQSDLGAQRHAAGRVVFEAGRTFRVTSVLHRHVEGVHVAEVDPHVTHVAAALDGHDPFTIGGAAARVRAVESQYGIAGDAESRQGLAR